MHWGKRFDTPKDNQWVVVISLIKIGEVIIPHGYAQMLSDEG